MRRFLPIVRDFVASLLVISPACYVAAGMLSAGAEVLGGWWRHPQADSLWPLGALSIALGVSVWRRRDPRSGA